MTKNESKQKRMSDIIHAALDEFLEKGYETTSMEAIALRAGISKGGLYHHFKSKDEILLYVNQKLDEPINQIKQEALKKTSAVEALTLYLKKYLLFWQQHEKEIVFYSLSLTRMLDSPSLWKMYSDWSEDYLNFLVGLYQKGIDSGEFVSHSAFSSALAFMGALDGIIFHLIMNKNLKLESVVTIFQEKFIQNIEIKKVTGRGKK
jgi:AcrR family transcriptional regulator